MACGICGLASPRQIVSGNDRTRGSLKKLIRQTKKVRSYGDSSWRPKVNYDVEDRVADVVELIDALRVDRFVLVGHLSEARSLSELRWRAQERYWVGHR